jgi:hypothetical protein
MLVGDVCPSSCAPGRNESSSSSELELLARGSHPNTGCGNVCLGKALQLDTAAVLQ